MDIEDEEFRFETAEQEDDRVLMEAWPVPSEESLKEFEDCLLDP